MIISVEDVKQGDSIELWIDGGPKAVVVDEISEGNTLRAFRVNCEGASFELNVPRGETVNLSR